MTLKTDFEGRFSLAARARWSNPDTKSSTQDDTRVTNAATDAESWFKDHVEVEYDDTNADHTRIGVQVVRAFLLSYGAASAKASEAAFERLEKEARKLRLRTRRFHAKPQSTSSRTVHQDKSGDTPAFNTPKFDDVVPDIGNSGRTDWDSG